MKSPAKCQIPESRAERAAGILRTGEMNGRRFAERIDVAHGTVKRWLHEGMPARRTDCGGRGGVWITPADGLAWVEARYPKSIARGRCGVVYVAVRATDGAVKIGWTSDVMRRVQELRKLACSAVELAACFPGDKPDELRLHARFSEDRLDGEWFRPSDALLAFVNGLRAVAA
jgi:hypothetical protein